MLSKQKRKRERLVRDLDRLYAWPGTLQASIPASRRCARGLDRATLARYVAPPTITPNLSGATERDRVITPYRADAWEAVLATLGLAARHSELVKFLRYGFPIGDLEPPTHTFTPPNHKGAIEHETFVEDYCKEQKSLGRMTGPYSEDDVRNILGTHYLTSPLSVVPKGEKFRLVQDLSAEDEDGVSLNSRLRAEDFPTRWGTAAQVAEYVSKCVIIEVRTMLVATWERPAVERRAHVATWKGPAVGRRVNDRPAVERRALECTWKGPAVDRRVLSRGRQSRDGPASRGRQSVDGPSPPLRVRTGGRETGHSRGRDRESVRVDQQGGERSSGWSSGAGVDALGRWAQEIDDHRVVVAFGLKPADEENADAAGESLVDLRLVLAEAAEMAARGTGGLTCCTTGGNRS